MSAAKLSACCKSSRGWRTGADSACDSAIWIAVYKQAANLGRCERMWVCGNLVDTARNATGPLSTTPTCCAAEQWRYRYRTCQVPTISSVLAEVIRHSGPDGQPRRHAVRVSMDAPDDPYMVRTPCGPPRTPSVPRLSM